MVGEACNLVEARGITKVFPGVKALTDVDFELRAGEVMALVGENGAGKSTLIKIITGVYTPDAGSLFVNGAEVKQFSPSIAKKMGIGTVFQELSLVRDLTVEENIFLGSEFSHLGILDHKKRHQEALRYLEYIGAKIDPREKVANLSAAQQQFVEIAKALSQEPSILILDEPTDRLFSEEEMLLFDLLKRMKAEGKGIIYITHKLEEIPLIADRVTVLRDGKKVGVRNASEITQDEMIKMMTGRELDVLFPKEEIQIGKEVLRVENLCVGERLKDISFSVREGEILAVMGLVGAGRSILAKTLAGGIRYTSGKISFMGNPVEITSPIVAKGLGIAFAPEDRRSLSVILQRSVKENILTPSLRSWFLKHRDLDHTAWEYVRRLNIRTPSIFTRLANLSGGNQQKVVIARWLCSQSKLFIFDEPTQGIDVGSKAEIYGFIGELAKAGAAIILISSDMKEIVGLADRVIVMYKGTITSEFERKDFDEQKILSAAFGIQAKAS
ncbi:MAG: sugar ABC transporter ATP-binding protein [Firmicutes bacterium]|nr:sugar ABC transporter ATP-binding protein [Bacillota bacterium]